MALLTASLQPRDRASSAANQICLSLQLLHMVGLTFLQLVLANEL